MTAWRTLLTGAKAQEFPEAIDLTIHTKCPAKWKLIDMETGAEYVGSPEPNLYGKWKRIKEPEEISAEN